MLGGVSAYPDQEPFDVQTVFRVLYGTNTWENLLDGRETISIDLLSSIITVPEIQIIDYGSFMLNDATLIVEGTLVPEPATLILLGIGCSKFYSIKSVEK